MKSTPIKRTKGLKRRSKSDHAKAKENAWNSFSRYIRTRDCLRFTGTTTDGKCVTCNREYPFKSLQAGHFIQGRSGSVLFDERIVYSQCLTADSNINMYGNYKKSIADIVIGDAVQAFDEGGFEKTIATVTDKSSFMPEKLYEVELEDGSKFYATPDHRVVANGKWVYIEDMLHDVSAYDILEL